MQHVQRPKTETGAEKKGTTAVLTTLVTSLVESGESKVQIFCQEFDIYYRTKSGLKKNVELEEKLKGDCERLLSVVSSLEVKDKVDAGLKLRALKVQIKALTMASRFQHKTFNKEGIDVAFVKAEPYRLPIIKLFQDVIATKKLDCKNDEACQTDLYTF